MNPQMPAVPLSVLSGAGEVTRESVLAQALTLWSADREAIAEELLLTVDRQQSEDAFELSPEWRAEIKRRLEAYQRGEVEAVDPHEMFRRLDEKYGR